MEKVNVIAKSSFVSQAVGSVNRKQKLTISKQLAHELHTMGLVSYEAEPSKKPELTPPQGSGQDEQSASLPVETASQTTTLEKRKGGRPPKVGN
jgi:hypothetical protein